MTSEKINGEQPNIIEFGGGAVERLRPLDWLSGERPASPEGDSPADRPLLRGAGIGLALSGFGLLLAAEWLPWLSQHTDPSEQDFPTATGGRIEQDVTQLGTSADILHLGWLALLGVVAVALVIRSPTRRVVAAGGLGLAGGQLALLIAIAHGILNQQRQVINSRFTPVGVVRVSGELELGFCCAVAALVLLAGALLLAGGAWRPRPRVAPDPADQEPGALAAPTDLTVSPVTPSDPSIWSNREDR
jgi:hypothetical protein